MPHWQNQTADPHLTPPSWTDYTFDRLSAASGKYTIIDISPQNHSVPISMLTLLRRCCLFFSTLCLLVDAEVTGTASLLGSTTPSGAFPRMPVQGWDLALAMGLEVLNLVAEAGGTIDFGFAEERRVDEELVLMLLCSRRCWIAGGSCFRGLSCTQKVCRLMGLNTLLDCSNTFSLVSESWINSSGCVITAEVVSLSLSSSLCEWVSSPPCSWLASLWASWHIASSWSPLSGLQLECSCPPLSCVFTLADAHLSLRLAGSKNTSSSSSSPFELQGRKRNQRLILIWPISVDMFCRNNVAR